MKFMAIAYFGLALIVPAFARIGESLNFPNLLVNAGFEHGDISGWFSYSNACSATTAQSHSGLYSAAGIGSGDLRHQQVNVSENTNYITSAWVLGTPGYAVQMVIYVGTSSTVIATSAAFNLTNSWQQIQFTWNSGANTSVTIDYTLTTYGYSAINVYYDDCATYPANTVGVSFSPSANPWPLIRSDDFNDSSTIDVTASNADGYNWYPQMFFGYGTNPSSYYSVSGGELQINNSVDNWSDTLHSARPGRGGTGYLGTVFLGGSGIYFEARIRFLNISSISTSGWPSFWLDSIKREASGIDATMPGHPGTTEAMEMDIMEFNPNWTSGDTSQYGFTIHDWVSPVSGGTPGIGNTCWLPAGTDVTQYHTYGMLWIPASAAGNWVGYIQSFFDGVAGPAYCWLGNQTYSGAMPPSQQSLLAPGYLGSEADQDQLMLIVGASQGGIPTIGIDYVKVWAANPSASMRTIPKR